MIIETPVFQRYTGEIWLLIAYTKAKFDNLPTNFLNQLREEIDRG